MRASRASLETWGGLTSAMAIDCVMPPFGGNYVDSYVEFTDVVNIALF